MDLTADGFKWTIRFVHLLQQHISVCFLRASALAFSSSICESNKAFECTAHLSTLLSDLPQICKVWLSSRLSGRRADIFCQFQQIPSGNSSIVRKVYFESLCVMIILATTGHRHTNVECEFIRGAAMN